MPALMQHFQSKLYGVLKVNSFLAIGYFCCLPITFASSFDPDQDQQNVSPDLDPNCFTLSVFLEEYFEKVNFEISQQTTSKA